MDSFTLSIPTTVITYAILHLGVPWLRAKMGRGSDRPPASSSSSDKMKAVAAELEHANTVLKVNELHEALAGKDSDDKGYIVPRQLKNQTVLLTHIKDELIKQTGLQRKNTPPPSVRPSGKYP